MVKDARGSAVRAATTLLKEGEQRGQLPAGSILPFDPTLARRGPVPHRAQRRTGSAGMVHRSWGERAEKRAGGGGGCRRPLTGERVGGGGVVLVGDSQGLGMGSQGGRGGGGGWGGGVRGAAAGSTEGWGRGSGGDG